jgi:hypothetical protein
LILKNNLLTLLEHIHEDVPVVDNGRISIELTIRIEAKGDFKLSARPDVAENTFEFG